MKSKNSDIGFERERQRYTVKVYGKGKLCRKKYRLRFEVKVTKMIFVKDTGIKVLSDLKNIGYLKKLEPILNKVFSELIITDRVNKRKLTANELRIYEQCSNPKEWEKLKPKLRFIRKQQFNKIIQRYGKRQWKETVARKIAYKWAKLCEWGVRKN